jgi:hypothetical protein
MHDASTSVSRFLNIYMIRCRRHQHCAHIGGENAVLSEPSVMASELRSLNDLPDEILLKIPSHFRPEDLCLNIAKVCERWNVLAKDVILWKTFSYSCDNSSDISCVAEVRCKMECFSKRCGTLEDTFYSINTQSFLYRSIVLPIVSVLKQTILCSRQKFPHSH